MTMKHELIDIAYHRNGIGGEGFYVAIVKSKVDGVLRKMVLDGNAVRTAVFDADLLAKDNIRFAQNSWRGDMCLDEKLKELQVAR